MSDTPPEQNSDTQEPARPIFPWDSSYSPQSPKADENTSGSDGPLPREIQNLRWSWGAFGLPGWWLISHNKAGAGVVVIVLGFVQAGLQYVNKPLYLPTPTYAR